MKESKKDYPDYLDKIETTKPTTARNPNDILQDLLIKKQNQAIDHNEQNHQENRSHRKDLVIFAKWFTIFYFGYVGMVILYCGFANLYKLQFLSDTVIKMLLGTTMGHALIILVIVMKYFFKNNDLKKSQNTNT